MTTSEVHIDPEVLKKRETAKEAMAELKTEKLPGKVKSQWALQYKLTSDINIEKALEYKKKVFEKAKTKGRFVISAKTNSGNFLKDREWVYKSNPDYLSKLQNREDRLVELLKAKLQMKIIA